MKYITDQEAFHFLFQAGFTSVEIHQLYWFRHSYQASELDQPALDRCRLEFARWLVETGRLTDRLSETTKSVLPSKSDMMPDLLASHERSRFPFFWRKEESGR